MKALRVLIVDDVELNREFLREILKDDYEILEAADGLEAIQLLEEYNTGIDIVLLDAMMPKLDGFGVLKIMNERNWIETIPVIMISAETSGDYISRGYELGVSDYIGRPFDTNIVKKRVKNVVLLYARQRVLKQEVEEQIRKTERANSVMVDILSTIVEFRNGESGLHVLRIRMVTSIFLEALAAKYRKYEMPPGLISQISNAAALHDIGKIAIPEEILNKPGKLTTEEFEIMKTHAQLGAQMLEHTHFQQNEDLVRFAHSICLSHHERWDGKGYPQGLAGEEIPLCAQVVSLADVYDALVSERVYKAAYSSEKAIRMILNGECGQFNPDLMACLTEEARTLEQKIQEYAQKEGELFNNDGLFNKI